MVTTQTIHQPEVTDSVREGGTPAPATDATAQPSVTGCTLQDLSIAKGLPVQFMTDEGWTDMYYCSAPAVRIPYKDADGRVTATRFRVGVNQDGERFKWKKGDRPCLYGLHELRDYDQSRPLYLVEGETDTATLWMHGLQAVGVPGSSTWQPEWSDYLAGFDQIYVVIEPDAGGATLLGRLSSSPLAEKTHVIRMGDLPQLGDAFVKDVNDLHRADPLTFAETIDSLTTSSIPLADALEEEAALRRAAAWDECSEIAVMTDIVGYVADVVGREVAGEDRIVRLLYLVATSRLLDQPASIAVKGPSSSGKSYVVKKVLEIFPSSAYLMLSGMSDKALAYMEEPLKHRCLIVAEAAGVTGEMADYLVRTLLSEGCIHYQTVGKNEEGPQGRLMTVEGPTSLIVTTTKVSLHAENETRLLSVTVNDSREQTRQILRVTAHRRNYQTMPYDDKGPLVAFQEWLHDAEHRVVVPFAGDLAELVSADACRMRRDFDTLITLVATHALIHQETRARDEQGRIVASLEDYRAVRELVADLIAEQLEAAVSPEVRETVDAVDQLKRQTAASVNTRQVAAYLNLENSAGFRRVQQALELGYLVNLEARPNRPYQLECGRPLPKEVDVLPSVETLEACAVAPRSASSAAPSPPSEPANVQDEEYEYDPFIDPFE